MKSLSFTLLFIFTGISCKKTEVELLVPCDCKNLSVVIERKGIKGMITFPNSQNDSYGILIPEFGGGDVSPYFGVCTDSTFINLIKTKKIIDSTFVKFDGGVIDTKISCKGYAAVRIHNLVKF